MQAYINNSPFTISPGETILDFVKRHKGEKYIPTLCDAPNLSPYGSCRVCSVEVTYKEGDAKKMVASCHNEVKEGMHIYTHSAKVRRIRKNIVELVITDHPLDCLVCEVNGHCELQDVAAQTGITEIRYPAGENHLDREKDLSHTYITSDLSKCINCYKCVRACDEVQGEFVLSMAGRGFDSYIIKGDNQPFAESPCVSCGACVQACPTAAISDYFHSKSPEAAEQTRTVCTYCGVGCNLDVHKSNGTILSVTSPYDAEVNQGHTCLKGRYAFQFYNHPDRLRSPLIKRNGQFESATWEEALDYIAENLTRIKQTHGPDAIAGISSSRCTNEENYLMQKFIRAVIGTNNIDGCARICHSPTALGMQRAFGTGAATNSVKDIQQTDCILIIGANPTTAHPVTGAKIKQAVIKGTPLIVIDPRKTELAKYADIHLALRPGSNVALLNMFMFYIIEEQLHDLSFMQARSEGYDDFIRQIQQVDIDKLESISGVPRELVRKAAIMYGEAPNAMCFHGLGVTEHHQGTFGVMQIANLALLTGNIGRPGVGVNPLRGQNNVQGAADMGVQPNQGPGYLPMKDPNMRRHYEEIYGTIMPGGEGYTIPQMFDAALNGELKALWIMGEDVVQTEPNSGKVRTALEKLSFFVLEELFMSDTASYADVILPASSFFEKNGTFTNGERRIQRVNQVVEPIEGTKPDGQIIVEIMRRMGYDQPDYHPSWVLEEISKTVPFFAGVSWENLGKNGKQWPVAPDGTDTKILHTESFKRGLGKMHFISFEESPELEHHQEAYPYILTTNRGLAHYNSGSMTRRTRDKLILGEDLLLINPADASKHGISDYELVRLLSPRGKVDIRCKITDMVKPGVVSSTFHFPEVLINQLTGDVLDTEADCPEYKVVAVRLEKLPVPAE